MDSNTAKTPTQLADEAKQAGHDAVQAAKGYAGEARDIGNDARQSLAGNVEDAKAMGREAADTAKGLAADAKDIAQDTADTGRLYAKDALNTAKEKIGSLQGKVSEMQDSCVQYIAAEPVRAVLYAAAAGALVSTLLTRWVRGGRYD